jgi:hypothetical protein
VDALEGSVHPKASLTVLKAATRIRLEVCGPLAQKHEVRSTVSVLDPYAQQG